MVSTEERGWELKEGQDSRREKEEKTETENPKNTNYLLDPAMTEASPAWAFKFHESALSLFC